MTKINLLRTLFSLKVRDEYPMYSMKYCGDYGFDEFIKHGAKCDDDIRRFVRKRLTQRKNIELNTPNSGCTSFVAKNVEGGYLYARNYDFPYAPSLVLKTRPAKGYSAISITDMTSLGYGKGQLPVKLAQKLPLLAAPYLPFDGMNEKGLAISILQVPETDLQNDPDKITLNTTTMIRFILDKTATVDEAIAVFRKYNIYFSNNVYVHYLIADCTGKAALVEFWNGEMHIVEENIATNFIAHNGISFADCDNTVEKIVCKRYEKVNSVLSTKINGLSMTEAAELLCDVGVHNEENTDMLQWSVVYNLSSLTGIAFPCRDMSKIYKFKI